MKEKFIMFGIKANTLSKNQSSAKEKSEFYIFTTIKLNQSKGLCLFPSI